MHPLESVPGYNTPDDEQTPLQPGVKEGNDEETLASGAPPVSEEEKADEIIAELGSWGDKGKDNE